MPNLPDDDAIEIVFKAIARSNKLSQAWILKGGNALKRVYQSPRASVDLDFTERPPISKEDEETLQGRLDDFCQELDRQLNQLRADSPFADFYVQSNKIKPANVDFLRSRPAFEIKAGYSRRRDREGPYSDYVKLEISLNDIVCEQQTYQVDGQPLNVCTINDIIAEKLRSLLQQKKEIRNRSRPGDVFDIWFFHRKLPYLFDYKKISAFLQEKSEGLVDDSLIKKSTFTDDQEVRERSQNGFDEIQKRLSGVQLPPFEQAWQEIIAVIEKLSIPD